MQLKGCGESDLHAQDPSCYSPSHMFNDEADFNYELDVCVNGPLHCHERGKCERRICKDLVARTNRIPPEQAPKCKHCSMPWVECIHSTCIPPTLDCLATNCTAPESTPNPACIKWCWSKTPFHCRGNGTCANPEYTLSGVKHQITPMPVIGGRRLMLFSRKCNRFRDWCLETCELHELHSKCRQECGKKFRKAATMRLLCMSECLQWTCYEECRIKTCCMGPQQCRRGGEAFRCEGVAALDCGRWAGGKP